MVKKESKKEVPVEVPKKEVPKKVAPKPQLCMCAKHRHERGEI